MQATRPICVGVWAEGTPGQGARGHLGAGLGAVGLCGGCQLHPMAACAAARLPSPSPLSASRGCCSRLSPPPFPWERVRRPPRPPLRPRPRRRPCTPLTPPRLLPAPHFLPHTLLRAPGPQCGCTQGRGAARGLLGLQQPPCVTSAGFVARWHRCHACRHPLFPGGVAVCPHCPPRAWCDVPPAAPMGLALLWAGDGEDGGCQPGSIAPPGPVRRAFCCW